MLELLHSRDKNIFSFSLLFEVSGLADKGVTINKVTCSDGATVCATDKGDIFLLNQYMCRKIISR